MGYFCQLSLQILNQNVENGANDFLDALMDAANNSSATDASNLLSFASRSLKLIVPNPMTLRRLVESIVDFAAKVPDGNGNARDRIRVPPAELGKYDQNLAELFLCNAEMSRDVLLQLRSIFKDKLTGLDTYRYLPLFDVIPRFFTGNNERQDSWLRAWQSLSKELDSITRSRATRFRAIALVLKGHDTDAEEFIRQYGVAGLYDISLVAPSIGNYSYSQSISAFLGQDPISATQAEFASRLVHIFPALPTP